MIAPPNAPSNGEIAWNSFAYVSTRADDNVTLLPAEPIKVGVKLKPQLLPLIGDRVWLDTNMDGIQDAGEAGIDNVVVDLHKDNGDGIPDLVNETLTTSTLTSPLSIQRSS